MAVEFYDLKLKQKVMIPEASVVKVTFTTKAGQVRYGLRGTTGDGRNLTKFVNKETWEQMNVPVES